MRNETKYTIRQLQEYIKWVGWKYQPPSNWGDKISLISHETMCNGRTKIDYDVIRVYLNGMDYSDATISITKLDSFLTFHNFKKPKQFKIN